MKVYIVCDIYSIGVIGYSYVGNNIFLNKKDAKKFIKDSIKKRKLDVKKSENLIDTYSYFLGGEGYGIFRIEEHELNLKKKI